MKLKPEWRILIEHVATGKKYRLAIIPQPWRGRYWLRFNGSASKNMPECTKTGLVKKIAEFLQLR